MKLKQSRPLASKASHWPPVSSRGGSSDGGEGYGFSVTVCTQRGLNLGLEQLGLLWLRCGLVWTLNRSMFGPRFSPDFARINTITCMCPDWLAKEACGGGVVVGVGVIWGSMQDQLGAQVSKREQIEELKGVKGHRIKWVVINSKQFLFVDGRQKIPDTYCSLFDPCPFSISQSERNEL